MGYRSNGVWVIKGPVKQIVLAWVHARMTISMSPEAAAEGDVSWDDFKRYRVGDTGYIRFEFIDWKWYDNYPSVQFYESVWTALSEHNDATEVEGSDQEISGKRIHIGEDGALDENEFGPDTPVLWTTNPQIQDEEAVEGEPLTTEPTEPTETP